MGRNLRGKLSSPLVKAVTNEFKQDEEISSTNIPSGNPLQFVTDSLCSPDWPQTSTGDPPASAFWVLGLQTFTIALRSLQGLRNSK